MKLYNTAAGRKPKVHIDELDEKDKPEDIPNLKKEWVGNKGTQEFFAHISNKRQEILDSVASGVYNTGVINTKQIAQLIEAESLKAAIENYLEN